jgi:hypothetical protein
MDTLEIFLIASGMALLFGGLVFLIPVERKLSASQESFEANQERIEYYLAQISRARRQGNN